MRFSALLMVIIFTLPQFPDGDICGLKNTAFREGETITYKVFYTLAGVYVEAGSVNFSCTVEPFNGKTTYHIQASGKTFPFYDNFYKVRDKYECYIDTGTLQPYKFIRDVQEGGTKKYENVRFDNLANTAITNSGVYKVPECIHDVLSSMYFARNMNFENMVLGDKIPFTMFLDNKVYPSYIRYMGREIIRTRYGRFHSIKFKPLLIKGTLFEAGEKMTVWVSDDSNHIPLRVESPIVVGSVKADLMDFRNIRAPFSSRINAH
jgi:hypothetical protein